jgi:hypothetical protein
MEIGVRYAIAAEAVYALGSMFNVDTSTWIPFVHNTAPGLGYTGGPYVSVVEQVRGVLGSDPQIQEQLRKNPGKVMAQLLRQAVPIPASDVLKRAISQVFETDETAWRVWGMPDDQESLWDRFLVVSGFTPLQGLQPRRRKLDFLVRETATAVPKTLQDYISQLTGEFLPPGNREALRDWEPLVGGER